MHDPNNPDWDICPGETLQERLDDTERYIEEIRLHFGLHLASVETNEPEEHHPNKETADALN